MVATFKTAVVSNPQSAGEVINKIAAMVGSNVLSQLFVITTADQYQYEIVLSTT